MSLRISVDEARAYFAHASQQKANCAPDSLPDEGFQYWADGGVCAVFHQAHWPGVWMAHYGVKPEAWGRTTSPAKAILTAFWQAQQPSLIIGWTNHDNRAALSFAKRIGFIETGRMVLDNETVIQQSWRPQWA